MELDFFFFIYLHIIKGLFFFRFRFYLVWLIGLFLYLLFIIEAFLGYVLVWAQISFWASIVITSLLRVIPFFGIDFVFWIWGGFFVIGRTLKFFFVFHFLIPFISIFFIFFHLFFLHNYGRTSFLLNVSYIDKIRFFSFFWIKDLVSLYFILFYLIWCFYFCFSLGDYEIFVFRDNLKSPIHIVPEWYYLVFYAILRSVYNKVIGVFLLFFRILILFIFCFFKNYIMILDNFRKLINYLFLFCCLFLGWIGQCYLEFPFIDLGGLFSFMYFYLLFLSYSFYLVGYFLFL